MLSADGSADGELSIVVSRGGAVGADASDEVEVGSALADVEDQFLIELALRYNGGYGGWGRSPFKSALSLNEEVASSTLAA